MGKRYTRGTSLVEILVVIVILAVGIFALVRLFPSGFISLARTKEQAMASQLARQVLEKMKGSPENIPFGIYPVVYKLASSNSLLMEVDSTVQPDDLGIWAPPSDVENAMGAGWEHYFRGPNRVRRVIGESVRVPAPKPIGSASDPLYYGGLYQVQYAPILYDDRVFLIYSGELTGNQIARDSADDVVPIMQRGRANEQNFFLDEENGFIWLPVSQYRDVYYKIDLSVWVLEGSQLRRHDYTGLLVKTTPNMLVSDPDSFPPPPALNAIKGQDLKPLLVAAGEQFHQIDLASVHVYRTFERINNDSAFDSTNPYQYKMVNADLGMVLFNPAGYSYNEPRQRRLIPLVANFDYDIFDWHIISDERQVGDSSPYQVKLTLENIKRTGDRNNDQSRWGGLGLPGINPNDPTDQPDFVIVDVSDGSRVVGGFDVNGLRGVVRMNDRVEVLRPGRTRTELVSPAGKTYRFLYMAHDDWAVQVQKAPARYSLAHDLTNGQLGVAQCYIDHEGGLRPAHASSPYMYFPKCDIGKTVVIRQYRYLLQDGVTVRVGRDEEFVIDYRPSAGSFDLASIDIRDHHPEAAGFEVHESALPADGIMGSSAKVRVLWAPTQRKRSDAEQADHNKNLRYVPVWRKVDFDTHLVKEAAE